jgi:hypothetical protein
MQTRTQRLINDQIVATRASLQSIQILLATHDDDITRQALLEVLVGYTMQLDKLLIAQAVLA